MQNKICFYSSTAFSTDNKTKPWGEKKQKNNANFEISQNCEQYTFMPDQKHNDQKQIQNDCRLQLACAPAISISEKQMFSTAKWETLFEETGLDRIVIQDPITDASKIQF